MVQHGMQGAYTALLTPFTADGDVDWRGLDKLLAYQITQGIDGILACGTTGESPTLDEAEHAQVIEAAVKQGRGNVHVMAGVGSNNTADAIHRAEHARIAGADSGLVVDCYYNGPSSSELRTEYYGAIMQAVPDLPFMAYVIPGRTGCALAAEDVAILAAETASLAGVKEATGDLQRMARTRELAGDRLSIMSGDDPLTLAMMTREDIRAQGVISVMSNIFPQAVAQMVRYAHAGDIEQARMLEQKLAPVFGLVGITVSNERRLPRGRTAWVQDKYRNPLPVKTMMAGLGLPAGPCRRPLGRMCAEGVQKTRDALLHIRGEAPELLEPVATFFDVDIDRRLRDDAVWQTLSTPQV
jgi:4-hydroxy-tetrahydrodipicolinate synthase